MRLRAVPGTGLNSRDRLGQALWYRREFMSLSVARASGGLAFAKREVASRNLSAFSQLPGEIIPQSMSRPDL
jgi:hypothetical protein